MKKAIVVLILCVVGPLFAQETASTAANPLAQLRDELKRVLDQAKLPFSDEQDKAITLMMEDRRKASEDLFGNLMDFRAGPTQGQDADRLRSAIDWMRNEFRVRLQDYLRPAQLAVWSRYQETGRAQAAAAGTERARPAQQTQYVRINNNVFTTETSAYGGRRAGGNDAEVIQRGGQGDYHGNAQLLLKDESLNAGKRFASNKPPYQERRASFNFSGPVIPGRLTTAMAANQNEAQNVDTIHATLADSIFALGITKPTTTRSFSVNNTFQIADAHSLALNVSYATDSRKNQGVGGFTLPERASSSYGTDLKFEAKQFSSFSARSIFENSFAYTSSRDKTTPSTQGLKINVIDAFQSGGAQNKVDNTASTYDFGNLYTHLGERLTVKAGSSVVYLTNRSLSENNFTGTFTFSSLEAYRNGQPVTFRVTQGIPAGRTNQWELGFFLQNDFKMTPRLTLMYGARYEVQTNVPDHNNLDPRLGFAYAVGRATVIRGGGGIFHDRLAMNIVEYYRRLDGTQQREIVIDNPSYPDPFKSGAVRNTPPTLRVFDPQLEDPYSGIASMSVERTFRSNLFVSVAYDYGRILHKYRNRNLNATYDARVTSGVVQACTPGQPAATCVRPDPARGNVINLESTGSQTYDNIRFNFRQRFSIFNVTSSYQYYISWNDSPSIGLVLNSAQGSGGGGSDNNGAGPEVLPTNNYNLRADWSRFAVPVHTFNASVNSRLPLGVFLTSALAVNDGRYYTITTGKDDNMDSAVNDRAPGVSRNSGDGQWQINTNFNLSKAFFFGAKPANGGTQPNVNLFANMTNAFNRPNYNNPSGVMTSPNFGKITSATEPRNIEVGMRFQF